MFESTVRMFWIKFGSRESFIRVCNSKTDDGRFSKKFGMRFGKTKDKLGLAYFDIDKSLRRLYFRIGIHRFDVFLFTSNKRPLIIRKWR